MRCLFLSDLHLASPESSIFSAFARLLKTESRRNDAIYILGDLVEAWVGDDDDGPLALELGELIRSCSDRADLYFMHGNRDFLIGEDFCRSCKLTLLPDPTPVVLGQARYLLSHGDAYCTSDREYMAMRSQFRSADWQDDFRSLPLDERKRYAALVRQASQEANSNKPANIADVVESDALASMNAHDCESLIHGHTHRPGIHELGQGRQRIVLGAWERTAWIARYQSRLELECIPLSR